MTGGREGDTFSQLPDTDDRGEMSPIAGLDTRGKRQLGYFVGEAAGGPRRKTTENGNRGRGVRRRAVMMVFCTCIRSCNMFWHLFQRRHREKIVISVAEPPGYERACPRPVDRRGTSSTSGLT